MKIKWIYLIPCTLFLFSCASPSEVSSEISANTNSSNSEIKVESSSLESEMSSEETSSYSEYELFKLNHPNYYGDETNYIQDLNNHMLEEEYKYDLISVDKALSLLSGSTTNDDTTIKFYDAVAELEEPLILPFEDDSSWEISFKGILNTQGQYLNSQYKKTEENRRIYFGINENNGLFIGVNIDNSYHNYCFRVAKSYLTSEHLYTISYEKGVFYLKIDNGDKSGFSTFNIGQANTISVNNITKASNELRNKIRAVTGEYYALIRYTGAENFTNKATLEYMKAKTSYIYNYHGEDNHSLKNKMIFQLGSSISYGHASGGRSFVEQIASITKSKYQKQTVSGTTLAKRSGQSNSYVERFLKFDFAKEPDILIVQLSTNDFSNNVPFGQVDDTSIDEVSSDDFDQYTIAGAIEYIVSFTREFDENIKIYFYSCPIKYSWGARTKYQLFLENQMQQIVDKWGIGLIDLFNANNISGTTYMSDDIHPNANGYADVFTPNIIRQLLDDMF